MSYLDWHVGMKVVCIVDHVRLSLYLNKHWWDRALRRKRRQVHPLKAGEVYTIAAIGTHFAVDRGEDLVVVILAEAKHYPDRHVGFPCEWFRPVQARKTDISVFTAMLNPAIGSPAPRVTA